MNEEVRSVILELLDEAYDAFKDDDSKTLKDISDYTLHYAGIFQDADSTSIAVLVYSLAKVLERRKMHKYAQWETFRRDALQYLKSARTALDNLDVEKYNATIKYIFHGLGKLEDKFGQYVTEVIRQAKIKKGSGVYEHGISVSRAAEILGISPWELSEFIGQRKQVDKVSLATLSVKERIKMARGLFR